MVEYIAYTKAELIDMLQLRDAESVDLQVLALKIEQQTSMKAHLQQRANEILNIGSLSSDEKNILSQALLNKAAAVQTRIMKLTDLQTKLAKTP